jgi:hypothetical protein
VKPLPLLRYAVQIKLRADAADLICTSNSICHRHRSSTVAPLRRRMGHGQQLLALKPKQAWPRVCLSLSNFKSLIYVS